MSEFSFDLPTNTIVTRRIRYLVQTEHNGSYASLFQQIYDHEPEAGRLKLFKAYIERGKINEIFMRRLAEKTKIGEVSLRRFFDLYVDNEELFRD